MKKYSVIIFLLVVLLIVFGSYLVLSASSTVSAQNHESQFYLFSSHVVKAIGGVVLMILFASVPYDIYRSISKYMLIVMVALLILTLTVSPQVNNVHRWLDLGFIRFQPSDLARLLLFIHLAVMLDRKGEDIKKFKSGLLYPLIWVGLVAGLIYLQPNISTATMIIVTSFIVLFAAGARIPHLAATAGGAIVAVLPVMMMFSHSRKRIMDFVNSIMSGGEEAINMQVQQAVYSLGSGGWLGVGFGHSSQRNLFLPYSYSDFIFAILGEETGFVGVLAVLIVYLAIFIFGILIAKNARDTFGQLLALSITVSLVLYAFVNAGVASGLLPTTGLPLPFISHGGTSMLVLSISMGILINIGFTAEKKMQLPVEEMSI